MKIELKEIPIRDIYDGYVDSGEDGIVGFGGKLDIRPEYQREFIYKDKQRDAVIETIKKDFPLNVMYWVKDDDSFEMLDGQQRTISICQYINGDFALNHRFFHNLEKGEKEQILNYKLMIYICEGNDREKLDWFETINIAGEKLTKQELRNATYRGPWLSDAKRYFSRPGCVAYNLAKDYLRGYSIRQDYLETAIDWISDGNIEDYMAINQFNKNANELWLYFQNVINWVNIIFPNYRKEMKGIDWGLLYNQYKDAELDAEYLEKRISELMIDEDVTKKKGIYEYLLTNDEKYLSIRAFSDKQKREAYEKQNGICSKCGGRFDIDEMEADHITPWSEGGATTLENCQMLCKHCNRVKSDK